MLYMVTWTISIPQMLAYIPYMDPMGMLTYIIYVYKYIYMFKYIYIYMFLDIHIYIYMFLDLYIYIYIYLHIHMLQCILYSEITETQLIS